MYKVDTTQSVIDLKDSWLHFVIINHVDKHIYYRLVDKWSLFS